jgi:hypothetical protein
VTTLALCLSIAVGIAGGTWEVARHHRRYPQARDTPPTVPRMVVAAGCSAAVFLTLAWAVGLLQVVYLAGGSALGLSLLAGEWWWPWFRARRHRRLTLR